MAYPLPGDSSEDKNLIEFALEVPGAHITCTTNHPIFTGAGFYSYHRRSGSNGNGLAVDVAGTREVMKEVFSHFLTQKAKLHELIHTPMGFSIKDGVQVKPIDAANHYNHVHISIKKGIFLPLKIPNGQEGSHMINGKVLRIVPTADNGGYWIFASDGGVFAKGNAQFYGSLVGIKTNAPLADVAVTPSGKGYIFVDEQGEVYANGKDGKAFGDAQYHGNAV